MTRVLSGVPVIDLHAAEHNIVRELARACSDWGFFLVANHGIPAGQATAALQASNEFFGQPLPWKQALSRSLDNPWGYYDRELTKNLRDRKEIFDFSPAETAPWPADLPDFKGSLQDWVDSCYELSLRLLALFCRGLAMEADHLRSHFQPQHSSFMRLNHYPVKDLLAGSEAPAPGPLGISRHSDAGALTVLLQDEVPGLQVFREEDWHEVKPEAGTLTINIGDMMQVWSNDRYPAPLHRVRASAERDRYSIAWFLNPNYNTEVAPLAGVVDERHPPLYRGFSWEEFRSLRAQGDYGDYGEEVQISRYRTAAL